jgi:hypothetical protein
MAIYKHPTLKEIRDAEAWKREYNRYLPIGRFVFRPLGYLLTWLAVRVGITSEAVSWLSGFVGLLGCLCLISGQKQLLALGIALLLFFNLLDTVDGSIARTMKTENSYGRFLDSLMAWIDMGFWALIGIMVYLHPDFLYFSNPNGYGPIFWLAVGGLTCYFSNLLVYVEMIFDQSVRVEWDSIRADCKTDSKSIPKDEEVKQDYSRETPPFSVVRIICHNLRVRETHYFLLVIAYWGKVIDLLLGLFLLYYFLNTIFLIIIYSKRGRQLRKFIVNPLVNDQ